MIGSNLDGVVRVIPKNILNWLTITVVKIKMCPERVVLTVSLATETELEDTQKWCLKTDANINVRQMVARKNPRLNTNATNGKPPIVPRLSTKWPRGYLPVGAS